MRPRVWIAALLGLLGAVRLLRRNRAGGLQPQSPDPAEELRAKLAEAREAATDRDEFEARETPVDEADVDSRRRSVHDAAQAAIDEMQRD